MKRDIMKKEFMIKLTETTSTNGYATRMYVNGFRTKYIADGNGYDKVADVFAQYIMDNFNDFNNQFQKLDRSIDNTERFIKSIGGIFEKVYQDKDIILFQIVVDTSKLKTYNYRITKSSKGCSYVWANKRIDKSFSNHKNAEEYIKEHELKQAIIKLYVNTDVKEIPIDEIARGYITSKYFKQFNITRYMPLFISSKYEAAFDYGEEYESLIIYYSKNKEKLAKELGISLDS